MKTALFLVTLLAAMGCATSEVQPEVKAVRDMIALEQPEEVGQIRLLDQLHYRYVNDWYVAVSQGSRNYLVEFTTRCRALRRSEFTPSMVDTRRDASYINAKWDTIRGCPIDKIYEVSKGQLDEIEQIHSGSIASGR